uniref:Uncharacterized protein n=1 Tax=Octopus bimaculoides TaxID=37653 RepID=A0A0L8I791_OCTBM
MALKHGESPAATTRRSGPSSTNVSDRSSILKWFDRVPNTNRWERANQEPIHVQIRQRKWRWMGHTLRKEPSNVIRQAPDWNPQWKRKRGRPKQTWKRSILVELRTTGLTWEAPKKHANDCNTWKITVQALCSPRCKKD